MRQHKLIFLIPSDRRLELERLIEELMEGVEGYRHVGTYEYDPDKPFFINRRAAKDTAKAANGAAAPKTPRVDDVEPKVIALMSTQHRPFTTHELARHVGSSQGAVSKALARLVAAGKVHQIVRGIYEIIATGGKS